MDQLAAVSSVKGLYENLITVIINPLVALLVAVALLVFFWGIFQMIASGGDGTKFDEGKKHLASGLFGLVIIFSVWGIIGFLKNIVGAPEKGSDITAPIQNTPPSKVFR